MKKKPIEKYVLAAALVFLALGGAALAYFFPTESDIYKGASEVAGRNYPAPLEDSNAEELSAKWTKPASWDKPEGEHRLFAPHHYMYDGEKGELISVRDSDDVPISDIITLGWARKYNLEIGDPDLYKYDPDEDGFYNKLEFEFKTDPNDPASHPPFVSRLRLRRIDDVRFRATFNSSNVLGGQPIFYIDITTEAGKAPRAQVLKIGDLIPGSKWKIIDYKPIVVREVNKATGIEQDVDKSELILKRDDVNLTYKLVRKQEGNLDEITAYFVMLLPGELNKDIAVKRGEDFSIPQQQEIIYKLIKASDAEATIRNTKDGKEIVVPKVTAEDERLVPGWEEQVDLIEEDLGY